MIKKQSVFYALIFLILTSMGQQTHAMKWTKHQWANGFRIGMKTLNYAGLISLPHIIIYQKLKAEPNPNNIDSNAKKLTPESEKYILDTIHQGYPELKSHAIKIVRAPYINFAAGWHNGTPFIYVAKNCDDKELNLAQQFKQSNQQRFSHKEFEMRSKEMNITIPEYIALKEQQGYAMTPRTLDVWKWALLHEGSHILHHDNITINTIAVASPFATLYAMEKIKHRLNLNILATRPILGTLIKGLGYIPSFGIKALLTYALLIYPYRHWAEYRSDQDAIKRTKDPAQLKATSRYFANLLEPNFQRKPFLRKMMHFYDYDVHPADKRRAKYFAEAAQKLEEKQAHQAPTKN